jgi:hypothetical protein
MNRRATLLMTITLLAAGAVFLFVGPVPQWPEYHDFADDRTFLGIANGQNVISNIGFLIVGVWGLLFVLGQSGKVVTGQLRASYVVLFIGLILTAFGSGYYHYQPGNQTLVWDRLPMTLMFMGLFATVMGELISPRVANWLLLPLLIIGIASVLWWAWTQSIGTGDLRAYGLVQFLPVILITFMLIMYPAPRHYVPYIVAMLLLAGLAKLCEQFDWEIYRMLGWVGGHALKHLLGAAASASVLMMLYQRTRLK